MVPLMVPDGPFNLVRANMLDKNPLMKFSVAIAMKAAQGNEAPFTTDSS
jgi:hypothetical protein